MTLSKEHSIAADSTVSASPPDPIKRSTHTYGRRKADPINHPDSSLTSRQSIYRTAPPDVDEEIPPSSSVDGNDEDEGAKDATPSKCDRRSRAKMNHSHEDDVGEDEGTKKVPSFTWDWQKRLEEMKNWDEDEGDDLPVVASVLAGGNTLQNSDQRDLDISLPGHRDITFSSHQGIGPSLASTSSPPLADSPFNPNPPEPLKKRINKDHSGFKKANILSSPISPAIHHHINTPKLHSSPTPPTSDEGEDFGGLPTKTLNKGKAKETSDSLLNSEEGASPSGTHNFTKIHASKATGMLRRKKNSKVKAPTKKELIEIVKDRSRIAAVQHISLPRSEEQKYTLSRLFESVSRKQPSSDPIQSFSSSPQVPAATFGATTSSSLSISSEEPIQHGRPSTPPPKARVAAASPLPELASDSDGGLPEVSQILKEREKADIAKTLADHKNRVLAEQAVRGSTIVSDDELEIVENMQVVAEEEAGQRRALKTRHIRPSEGRKRQLRMGGVRHHEMPSVRIKRDPLEQLKAMAEPSFKVSDRYRHGKRREVEKFDQCELNRVLAKRVAEDNTEITRKKEEEWSRRGGRPVVSLHAEEPRSRVLQDAWKPYAERGLMMAGKLEADTEDDGENDASDEDWMPEMRGSASPRPDASDGGSTLEGLVSDEEHTASGDAENDGDEETEDADAARPRPFRSVLAKSRAVLDSDDSDMDDKELRISRPCGRILVPDTSFMEDGMPPPRRMPVVSHRRSSSSLEDRTEDDTDKENNTRLMYDRSEDKENRAVVRHSPFGAFRGRSQLSLGEGSERSLSLSPGFELSLDYGSTAKEAERGPFTELSTPTEDPFTSPTEASTSFAARLRQISPTTPQPTFAPKVLSFDKWDSGFSQFLDDDGQNDENAPPAVGAPTLQPGFSQLFECGTLDSGTPTSEEHPPALDRLRHLGDGNELSLTLDVRLQPALEVSEKLRRQADTVFEKEQGYLLEAARRKPKQTPELYVNDHGFLTQTRPDVSSPEIYRLTTPSQKTEPPSGHESIILAPVSKPRHPLRTLSLLDDLETPTYTSRGRLRRRNPSPLAADVVHRSNDNAFDILTRNARLQGKTRKPEVRLSESEFVEAEAQESDDDELRGFGVSTKKDDDEDEDGDDLDKNLEGLVDDKEMDATTLAVDKVLEKVQEHREQDDLQNERIHRDAVEGKLRLKRRNRGLDLDDSEEEDEDEDERASRIRRRMHKRRRIDGDDLEALGQDKDTKAFYDAYQKDLADDDQLDFAHLQGEDVEMKDETEEEREIVSVSEIRERARKLARTAESSGPINPHDVSWIDREDLPENEDDAQICIREVSTKSRKQPVAPRSALDQVDVELPKRASETERERARLLLWAKGENQSRNIGTGRVAIGAAVTGHGKSKVRGEGPARSAQATGSRNPVEVSKKGSILASIADRTERFEHC